MKKNFRIFSVLLVLLLLISFNVSAQPEQVLKIGIGTDITTFDMTILEPSTDRMVGSLVYNTLLDLAPDDLSHFIPMLATSWEQKDEKTWIFNLREGVKFTDGTTCDAAAVKFSLERASTGAKSTHYQGMIEGVDIINDYQVEVRLKAPSSSFMSSLSVVTGSIISPTNVEKYGKDWPKHPVGTGMFKLEEWKPGVHVSFTRNDDYWGTPSKLDKVMLIPIANEATRVFAFKAGEIDVCMDLPSHEVPSVEADPNFKIQVQQQLRTLFLVLDTLGDPLKDTRIRQAIALGIDTEAIHKYTMDGLAPEAKYGFFPPYILKKDGPIGYGYDPERAKELLAEAGYPDGLELNLWAPEGRYAKGVEICQVIQGQLRKIGIDLKLSIMESAVFWNRTCILDIEKPFQIIMAGWTLTPDPYAPLFQLFRTDGLCDFANLRSPYFEASLQAATETADPVKRAEMYIAMDKQIVEDVLVIPIYYGTLVSGVNEKVQNFLAHPRELLLLKDTYIK